MDFSELVGVIGIYAIRIQDYVYIGQASDIYRRWIAHLSGLRRNKHCNKFLQSVFNKYGESALYFSIIDETLKSDLTPSEQWYLDTLKMFHPNDKILNLAPVAGSKLGVKHSDEAKAKMRAASLNMSAETKAKISTAKLGNTSRAKTHNIILLAPSGARHGPITNIAAFSRKHGLNTGGIHSIVTGKRKSHNGWRLFVSAEQT